MALHHWVAVTAGALIATSLAGQAPRLVSVGTHRLEVRQWPGPAGPTLVFEAGLGDDISDWDSVLVRAAAIAPVVAYARAGLGRSDPVTGPHTASQAVRDLHDLLAVLHIVPPYVLVGSSYGGLLVRLYTSVYPHEVAGLVLVDGVHEEQVRRWGVLDSTYPAAFKRFFDSVLAVKPSGAEAEETRETMRIQAAGTVEGLRPLPDIPIAVLTSMKVLPNAEYVNGTARGHEAWRAMHDEWARRSRNAIHVATATAGHHIQDDDPNLVLEAIRFVLERIARRP
jgi:pimeloyl-ACP methyl ester carboxylesterase